MFLYKMLTDQKIFGKTFTVDIKLLLSCVTHKMYGKIM